MLAWREIRRSKVKFALLTSAVALIVFLMVFLTALSLGLIRSITGAISGLQADAVVYSQDSRANMQVSRLSLPQVREISNAPGVAAANPIGTTTVSTETDLSSSGNSLQLFTTPAAGQTGAPSGLSSGRLPTASNEVALDGATAEIGSTVTIEGGPTLTVVGVLKGAQFSALPTGYVTFATYESAFRAVTPGASAAPINAVAVTAAPGTTTQALIASVQTAAPGTTAYTTQDAAAAIPGAESITQTFGILIGLALVSGVVVVGFFFLILTVAKLRSLTVLRAIGASTGRLAGVLFAQITAVVVFGVAVGSALAIGAISGLSASIPVSVSPSIAIGCGLAVLLGAYLAGAISIRRISAIEPATAVSGGPQ